MIDRIRPSKLGLAVKCPASLIPTQIEDEPTPQAETGTMLHEYLDHKKDIPDSLATRHIWMIESARGHISKEASFEQYINLNIGGVDLSGTADACWIDNGIGVVADLKTGEIPVETAGNYQLGAYALGFCLANNLQFFRVGILQPHIQKTVWCEGTVSALKSAIESAIETIKINPVLENCGQHCDTGYCPRRKECASYLADRGAIVADVGTKNMASRFAELTIEEQIKVAEKARIAKKYCDDILSEFRKTALSGAYGDAVEVKTIQGNRKISDAQKAFQLSGLSASEFMSSVNVSFSKLVGIITDKHREEFKTKKEAENNAKMMLETVTEREAEKITVTVKKG